MNASIVYWWMILFGCLNISLCEVIFREWNVHEGSVCFMTDESRGICLPNCVGQTAEEYQSDVCNPGQDKPLYCCVERDIARLYPTLNDNCFKRMLYQEFIERAKHKLQSEEYNYAPTYNFVKEEMKNHDKQCYEEALHLKNEDEESDFLENCLNVVVNNDYDQFIRFPRKGIELLTTAGLYYKNNDTFSLECTAIFIHRSFFLTSASCLTKAEQNGKIPNLIYFPSHSHFLTSDIEEIFVHENYSPQSLNNDIAIIKGASLFDKNFQWNPNMLCLWTHNWIPFEDLSVSLHSSRRRADKVQPVRCESSINANTISCNVCDVKEEDELKDGLFVGPIYYSDTFQPLVPRLIGIGSFDVPCSDGKPARITTIYSYLQWIENIISERSLDMCIRS